MLGNDMMQQEIDEMGYVTTLDDTPETDYDFDAGIATISCSQFVQVWRINSEGELLEQIF